MDTKILIEILQYSTPAIVTGIVATYFFKEYAKSDANLERFKIAKNKQQYATNMQLQAYERMTLFLERISPNNLVIRIKPVNKDKQAYLLSLMHTVDKEFEHNLSQQIYISKECWAVINTSKNATLNHLREIANDPSVMSSADLRKKIVESLAKKQSPTEVALNFIKDEVASIL